MPIHDRYRRIEAVRKAVGSVSHRHRRNGKWDLPAASASAPGRSPRHLLVRGAVWYDMLPARSAGASTWSRRPWRATYHGGGLQRLIAPPGATLCPADVTRLAGITE